MSNYLKPNPGTFKFRTTKSERFQELGYRIKAATSMLESNPGNIPDINHALDDLLELADTAMNMKIFNSEELYRKVLGCKAHNLTRFNLGKYIRNEIIPTIEYLIKEFE